jgi:glycerol-3-phosphate acyltransferase PlsY
MAFDISKSFAAYKLSQLIFASNPYAGIVSGIGAILGHNYPFYLKFKGGKGFAAFGGIILAYNWKLFLFLLAITVSLMLVVNYTFIMPYSGSILFPVIVGITNKDIIFTALCLAAGIIIMIKHYENVKNAINGSDPKVRDVISDMFTKKKATENNHNAL